MCYSIAYKLPSLSKTKGDNTYGPYSEDYPYLNNINSSNLYNTILEAIISELVSDGIIEKQQKESAPDDLVDKYGITQKLDKICKDFRDSSLSF